jgi:hypothetical protein
MIASETFDAGGRLAAAARGPERVRALKASTRKFLFCSFMIPSGCNFRRRRSAATIDDAYAFHLTVLTPNIDVFADLNFCPLNVRPFAAAPHVKLGSRRLLLVLEARVGVIMQPLVDFGLLKRRADAGGVRIFKGRAQVIRQGRGCLPFRPFLMCGLHFKLPRLTARGRRHVVNVP